MKAIVSVFARDSKGITAYVTTLLAENEINILDISQTLMQEYFAMIMLVDIQHMECSLDELKESILQEVPTMTVHVMHEDIFNSMHRI